MKKIVMVIGLFFLACGCSSKVVLVSPHHQSVYPPRTLALHVKILSEMPSEPFVDVGYLQGSFDSVIRIPAINEEKLRRKAAHAGADAIIGLSCIPDGIGWGSAHCQGIAIRFTGGRQPPSADGGKERVRRVKEEKEVDEEFEKRKAEEYSRQLIQCYVRAYQRYIDQWNSDCKTLSRAKNCNLPGENVKRFDHDLLQDKKQCLKDHSRKTQPAELMTPSNSK